MNGKGDKPRNCSSAQFKDNYDQIDWKKNKNIHTSCVSSRSNRKQTNDRHGDRHQERQQTNDVHRARR